jgi:group I intron endonuclease
MNIYTIYRATNIITGKQYVGFTSRTIEQRVTQHKYLALNQNSQTKFHKSIREFGWDNYVFEIIYQSKENVPSDESYTLTVMEDYFIRENNTIVDGYNQAQGGAGFPVMRGEEHPFFGKSHEEIFGKERSDEIKEKLRKNQTGPNNVVYRPEVRKKFDGLANPAADQTIYKWENLKTKEKVFATRYEMCIGYNLDNRNVQRLFDNQGKINRYGRYHSVNNWMLLP